MRASTEIKMGRLSQTLQELTGRGLATLISHALRALECEDKDEDGKPDVERGESWTTGIEKLLQELPKKVTGDLDKLRRYAAAEAFTIPDAAGKRRVWNGFDICTEEVSIDDVAPECSARFVWTTKLLLYLMKNQVAFLELVAWGRSKLPGLKEEATKNQRELHQLITKELAQTRGIQDSDW